MKERRSLWSRFKFRPIDEYFLEEQCPYSQRRKIRTKNVKVVAGTLIALFVISIALLGNDPNQERIKMDRFSSEAKPRRSTTTEQPGPPTNPGMFASVSGPAYSYPNSGLPAGIAARSQASTRQYSASQIVKSGTGGNSGLGLPMGSTIHARLENTLLSSDASQPVLARITDDITWRNSLLIPAGTRAIGKASFDSAARRLQVRFHAFVYPEGDQHSFSGVALLDDGSSGLPGDYHSGTGAKEVGRFLGNFVGGLADGMKDRTQGSSGIAFEPGSLRNGVLNGLTVSSLDQAKALSESMEEVHPYLEVPGGTPFALYFEKEYSP